MIGSAESKRNQAFIEWARSKLAASVTLVRARSGDVNVVYELSSPQKRWFLKISPHLKPEHERLQWLQGKLAVPEVVDFISEDNQEALLITGIEGTDLAHLTKSWTPEKIVTKLANALRTFHETDANDCPFTASTPGNILVHGDACLPNFIFHSDGTLSGYIDLGDIGRGDAEVDLSAAVWSLQYNLGPGYGLDFLRQYGIDNANEEMVEHLRVMYEQNPRS